MTPAGRLEFRSSDLVSALAALTAAQKHGRTIHLSFTDGELQLSRGVTTVRVPAHGSWPAGASVGTQFVKDLLRRRKVLPEVMVLHASESHLHFSHYSVPCSWVPTSEA